MMFETITISKDKLPKGKNCWHCEYVYFMGHKDFPPYRCGCEKNGSFDAEKCKDFRRRAE